jgi:hypothetical protein
MTPVETVRLPAPARDAMKAAATNSAARIASTIAASSSSAERSPMRSSPA